MIRQETGASAEKPVNAALAVAVFAGNGKWKTDMVIGVLHNHLYSSTEFDFMQSGSYRLLFAPPLASQYALSPLVSRVIN